MSEDDTAMLAMWDAKMSTGSIALLLGRKEHAVDRRIHQLLDKRLQETLDDISARPTVAEAAAALPPELIRPPEEVADMADQAAAVAAKAEQVQGPKIAPPELPAYQLRQATRIVTAPISNAMPPAPPRAWRRWVSPPAGSAGRRVAVPVTPSKRRYIGWFLNAGWPEVQVAHLFDVDVADLREAFARG